MASKKRGKAVPRAASPRRTVQPSTLKVGPVDPAPVSPFGFLRGTVLAHGDIVAPDHETWRRSGADPLDVRKR